MGWKDKEGLKLKLKKFRIAEGGLQIGGRTIRITTETQRTTRGSQRSLECLEFEVPKV